MYVRMYVCVCNICEHFCLCPCVFSREDYEFCFLKPAKEVILEPLVHRLLHAMPSNPLRFLQRQFSMFAVIIKQFSEGLTSSLDREELSAFLESIGLEKNEAELQAIIQQAR